MWCLSNNSAPASSIYSPARDAMTTSLRLIARANPSPRHQGPHMSVSAVAATPRQLPAGEGADLGQPAVLAEPLAKDACHRIAGGRGGWRCLPCPGSPRCRSHDPARTRRSSSTPLDSPPARTRVAGRTHLHRSNWCGGPSRRRRAASR